MIKTYGRISALSPGSRRSAALSLTVLEIAAVAVKPGSNRRKRRKGSKIQSPQQN
ncbi:hypothetical protein DPMN_136665 [Dreissena polymorpha]|uniref:Uncharacterized protein n=1 Tax=Dreissena polymorpha TaxID=45954 RepID=A0A9D4JI24_DREPO|nr:hypothetical protein DPMN_136665 [Dreissena polymorpha]